MKLFVYTSLDEALRAKLREALPAAVQPVFKDELSKDQYADAFREADIIMGNPPVDWFREVSPNLAFWQLDSAGFEQYRHLPINVPVANMGDFFSRPCAETIVGGILAFYRGIHVLVKCQAEKKWIGKHLRYSLDLLGNKNVMILGAGTIAQSVKQMLTGFGCGIKMTARRNPAADIHSFEELLASVPETDVVINTLPGAAEKYVSSELLQTMKPGSLYASIGRGNTTDEQSLIAALQSGMLAGAVLDVTAQEPLPEDNPLWNMDNVILTQHTGGGYFSEDEGKVKQFISNINRLVKGENIQDQVNLSRGY